MKAHVLEVLVEMRTDGEELAAEIELVMVCIADIEAAPFDVLDTNVLDIIELRVELRKGMLPVVIVLPGAMTAAPDPVLVVVTVVVCWTVVVVVIVCVLPGAMMMVLTTGILIVLTEMLTITCTVRPDPSMYWEMTRS